MSDKKKLLLRKIIKELFFSKTLTCAEISMKLDKSFPSITKMLDRLMEDGVVSETGFAVSNGGRRPLTYALNKDLMYIVAVAMDQFVTRVAVIDMQSNIHYLAEPEELMLHNNPEAFPQVISKIEKTIADSGVNKEKIIGIGVGMPGLVNSKKGINYSFFSSQSHSLASQITETTGIPAFIDNDSSLIALTELKFGAARNKSNAMVINIGWGVGLGMILNGHLFRGSEGFAGEFSHIPLFRNNRLCSCGKIGCLETETSLLVMVEKAISGLREGRQSKLSINVDEDLGACVEKIIFAAQQGDQFAVELFSEAGYNIGKGVATLIHLINPETIILSGRGALAGKIWQAPIQHALNEHCIPRLYEKITIEVSSIAYNAELIGAAALVMENFEDQLSNHAIIQINKPETITN